MEIIEHLQRAVDFIEANLRADITVEDVSREAGFSVYYFCRLFAAATGLPVMQFITQRRLRHAACEIAHGTRIIDVALEYGFDSASGFTRAFRREFGMSPREYARRVPALRPMKLILKELNHIMISQKLIDRALNAWNISGGAQSIIVSSGARSENLFQTGEYLLHAQPVRSTLSLAMAAEECLLRAGLPAAHTVPTAQGERIIELDGLYFRLTSRLRGTFVPAKDLYDHPSCPQAIGAALARLHNALRPLQTLPELNRPNLLKSTLEWSLPKTAAAMHLSSSLTDRFSARFAHLFPYLPVTPIHRNPTPDAFLFDGTTFTGYAGFEMTEVNIRLFDVCYAATAILSETLGRVPDHVTDRWPSLLSKIIEGYDSVSPLTDAEHEAVPYVVCAIQMVCVAYFSGPEKFRQLAETNIQMTEKIIEWMMREPSA